MKPTPRAGYCITFDSSYSFAIMQLKRMFFNVRDWCRNSRSETRLRGIQHPPPPPPPPAVPTSAMISETFGSFNAASIIS